jgi:octaprenyl-diphosphate synthase
VRDCGALDYTRQAAINEGNQAIAQLDLLPSNAYTEAMRTLTVYSLSRLS